MVDVIRADPAIVEDVLEVREAPRGCDRRRGGGGGWPRAAQRVGRDHRHAQPPPHVAAGERIAQCVRSGKQPAAPAGTITSPPREVVRARLGRPRARRCHDPQTGLRDPGDRRRPQRLRRGARGARRSTLGRDRTHALRGEDAGRDQNRRQQAGRGDPQSDQPSSPGPYASHSRDPLAGQLARSVTRRADVRATLVSLTGAPKKGAASGLEAQAAPGLRNARRR